MLEKLLDKLRDPMWEGIAAIIAIVAFLFNIHPIIQIILGIFLIVLIGYFLRSKIMPILTSKIFLYFLGVLAIIGIMIWIGISIGRGQLPEPEPTEISQSVEKETNSTVTPSQTHIPSPTTEPTAEVTAVPSSCLVPNLENLSGSVAAATLTALGLKSVIAKEFNDDVDAGVVVSQDPPPGTLFSPCEGNVTYTESLGRVPTSTPTPLPTNTATPTSTPTLTPLPTSTNTPDPWPITVELNYEQESSTTTRL